MVDNMEYKLLSHRGVGRTNLTNALNEQRCIKEACPAENTLEAFKYAREQGITSFETDIMVTKDGHLVCLHDKELNQNIYGAVKTERDYGYVSEKTLAELKEYSFGPNGEKIITLDELCQYLYIENPSTPPAKLLLELKSADSGAPLGEFLTRNQDLYGYDISQDISILASTAGIDKIKACQAGAPEVNVVVFYPTSTLYESDSILQTESGYMNAPIFALDGDKSQYKASLYDLIEQTTEAVGKHTFNLIGKDLQPNLLDYLVEKEIPIMFSSWNELPPSRATEMVHNFYELTKQGVDITVLSDYAPEFKRELDKLDKASLIDYENSVITPEARSKLEIDYPNKVFTGLAPGNQMVLDIAHRGVGRTNLNASVEHQKIEIEQLPAENTERAFRYALDGDIANGRPPADGIETDFVLTKDGVAVVCHNQELHKNVWGENREQDTNNLGNISDYTFAELQQFQFGPNPDDKLMSATQFFELIGEYNVNYETEHGRKLQLILEVKDPNVVNALVESVYDAIDDGHISKDSIAFFSTKQNALKEIRSIDAELHVGYALITNFLYENDRIEVVEKGDYLDYPEWRVSDAEREKGYREDALDDLKQLKEEIGPFFLVPLIHDVTDEMVDWSKELNAPMFIGFWKEPPPEQNIEQVEKVAELYKNGIPVLPGSDYAGTFTAKLKEVMQNNLAEDLSLGQEAPEKAPVSTTIYSNTMENMTSIRQEEPALVRK
jgi:glycerophosphoryl diester phosphodiesterase